MIDSPASAGDARDYRTGDEAVLVSSSRRLVRVEHSATCTEYARADPAEHIFLPHLPLREPCLGVQTYRDERLERDRCG